jgi:hypothetical protein
MVGKFIVLGHELTYFVKHETKGRKLYTENEVISMLEFLIDNILVEFGRYVFQQIIDIHMGTNCASLPDYMTKETTSFSPL